MPTHNELFNVDTDLWMHSPNEYSMNYRYLHDAIPGWLNPVRLQFNPGGGIAAYVDNVILEYEGKWHYDVANGVICLMNNIHAHRINGEGRLEMYSSNSVHQLRQLGSTEVYRCSLCRDVYLIPWKFDDDMHGKQHALQ